ncbi:MAG TPA: hypothetical protein VHC95_12630 [Opitutales bacterium]|nr:hypothetical protein [Opitutales bacterium]
MGAPRGPGGPGGGFGQQDTPSTEEMATLNKALKALLAKDPDAAKVLAAHPNYNPLVSFGGGRGGFGGGTGGGRGSGGRRGGGGGGGGAGG